jgi:hypothetical protein
VTVENDGTGCTMTPIGESTKFKTCAVILKCMLEKEAERSGLLCEGFRASDVTFFKISCSINGYFFISHVNVNSLKEYP